MAKQNYNKLELTWIGKGAEPKLEPRILIENPEYSYGDPKSENMLIHGDNLLALKALEQNYSGQIKCIYIDPPYNTGGAFEHYDDNLEHSIWLNLMYNRLKILHNLLHNEGSICFSIDQTELSHLKVICDEVFGRNNFVNIITLQTGESQRAIGGGESSKLIKKAEYLLLYSKNIDSFVPNKVYQYHSLLEIIENKFNQGKNYEYSSLMINFGEKSEYSVIDTIDGQVKVYKHSNFVIENIKQNKNNPLSYYQYLKQNFNKVFRTAISQSSIFLKIQQISNKGDLLSIDYMPRSGKNKGQLTTRYFLSGNEVVFLSSNTFLNDNNELVKQDPLSNIWLDIKQQGIANEGNVQFKFGKKPEFLIKRIFELLCSPGDLVLDSFLGSGSTAAVAHKMDLKWIGVELGEHAVTHCFPRLKAVVDGEQGGISKAVDWQGGGGFKFYNLAPSLLNEDKYGNWIISKEYNAQMLASAVAKQEGFKYEPDEHVYWKQGMSSEKDFIFTTTQFITAELMDKIHEEMQPGESLLIACKSFQEGCENRHANISIKKIPHMLMGRCEYGKDDYSFNIVNMPVDEDAEPWVAPQVTNEAPSKKKNKPDSQPGLFDNE